MCIIKIKIKSYSYYYPQHYIRIYGNVNHPWPRGFALVLGGLLPDVVDSKCYIPTGMKNACYLSYLTYTTSYQSQEPNDKLLRMTQPVLSL